MSRIFFFLLIISPLFASAQSFDAKTNEGMVKFTYDEDTKGIFNDVTATIKFDLSDLSKGSLAGSVNVASIDTQNKLRNKHLKGKDYFDVENYPTMTFVSTSISDDGNGAYTIKGILKIKSTEKEVTFNVVNKDGNLIFETFIYGLDFDVAVGRKREKTGIEIFVEIPV